MSPLCRLTQEVYSRILEFLTTSEMACLALTRRRMLRTTLSSTVYLNRLGGIVLKLESQVMYLYKKYNRLSLRSGSRLIESVPLRSYDNVRRRYLLLREYHNRFSKTKEPMTCVFSDGNGGEAPLLFSPNTVG